MVITNKLVSEFHFTPTTKNKRVKGTGHPLVDGSCYKRIHDLTFLVWYEDLKHFSIMVKFEFIKGLPAGIKNEHKEVILPAVVESFEQALLLLTFLGISNG